MTPYPSYTSKLPFLIFEGPAFLLLVLLRQPQGGFAASAPDAQPGPGADDPDPCGRTDVSEVQASGFEGVCAARARKGVLGSEVQGPGSLLGLSSYQALLKMYKAGLF